MDRLFCDGNLRSRSCREFSSVKMKLLSKLVMFSFLAGVLVFAFSTVYRDVTYEQIYNGSQARFFYFISDPANLKKINPTVLDVSLSHCTKTQTVVTYTEHLVQMPQITNYATAVYEIDNTGPVWMLKSTHITCFYTWPFCLTTNSTITVETVQPGQIRYREQITYPCLRMLSTFCSNEVRLQRALIINSLKKV